MALAELAELPAQVVCMVELAWLGDRLSSQNALCENASGSH